MLNISQKHGIADEDLYNFDETRFQMEAIPAAKLVRDTGKTRINPI